MRGIRHSEAWGNRGEDSGYSEGAFNQDRFNSTGIIGTSLHAGGFALIGVEELLAFWWAALAGKLSREAWKTWAALQEIRAAREAIRRKNRSSKERVAIPRFSVERIQELQGNRSSGRDDRRIGRAIRQLERAGLIRWSEEHTVFARGAEAFPAGDEERFQVALSALKRRNFRTPVSRKLLRHLAKGAKKSVYGCAVVAIIRATGQRQGQVMKLRGTVRSDVVQQVFGIAPRTWRDGLSELEDLGVLKREHFYHPAGQHEHGVILALAMDWYGVRRSEIAAHFGRSCSDSAAPKNLQHPLKEDVSENQKRNSQTLLKHKAPRGGAGVLIRMPKPRAESSEEIPTVQSHPVDLTNIQFEDLKAIDRLLVMADLAIAAGWARNGPRELQTREIVALACHAVRIAKEDPTKKTDAVRVFASNLRHRRFEHIALADEDKAMAILRVDGRKNTGGGMKSLQSVLGAPRTAEEGISFEKGLQLMKSKLDAEDDATAEEKNFIWSAVVTEMRRKRRCGMRITEGDVLELAEEARRSPTS